MAAATAAVLWRSLAQPLLSSSAIRAASGAQSVLHRLCGSLNAAAMNDMSASVVSIVPEANILSGSSPLSFVKNVYAAKNAAAAITIRRMLFVYSLFHYLTTSSFSGFFPYVPSSEVKTHSLEKVFPSILETFASDAIFS